LQLFLIYSGKGQEARVKEIFLPPVEKYYIKLLFDRSEKSFRHYCLLPIALFTTLIRHFQASVGRLREKFLNGKVHFAEYGTGV